MVVLEQRELAVRQDVEVTDSVPTNWISKHSVLFYSILGGVLGLVLLICLVLLFRTSIRQWACCGRRKDSAVPQVQSVGLWGRSDAPTFQKSGVYLTDLKRQFGTPGKGKKDGEIDIVSVAQDPEKGPCPDVPTLVKGAGGGPKIIDCGMNIPDPARPPPTGRPWMSPRSPAESSHTFFAKGAATPLSPVPASPAPKTPASKLAKEWKKDAGRSKRDTNATKFSSGSSFGQPFPVARGSVEDPMPAMSPRDLGPYEQPSRSIGQSNPPYRSSSLSTSQPYLPRRHRDSDESLDFVLPRERMTDQRAAPALPKGARRPPTNFSLDTSSTPSIYSTSTPAQSMYIPSSGARVSDSPALSGKSDIPPPPRSSNLSISIPKPGSPDRTRLQVRKSQSASSLHSPRISSPLASGGHVSPGDWTIPRFQGAHRASERDWRVSVISTHAL